MNTGMWKSEKKSTFPRTRNLKSLLVCQNGLLVQNKTVLNCTQHALFNPLRDNKILDWSKLKQIAEDILKCI